LRRSGEAVPTFGVFVEDDGALRFWGSSDGADAFGRSFRQGETDRLAHVAEDVDTGDVSVARVIK
jgi:hypothetical protein